MTNQQGAPEAPSYEHQRAIMEGERNASLDAYSRVVYLTQTESRIYEAAFTNGWNRLAALVEAQQLAAHVQNPAKIEHVAGDVSKNIAGSNMAQQPAPSAAGRVKLPEPDTAETAPWTGWKVKYHSPDQIIGYGNQQFNAGRQFEAERLAALRAPQPSPTPQADSQPAPDKNGFWAWWEPYQLPEGWIARVDLVAWHAWQAATIAASAPADSVTAPAGGEIDRLRAQVKSLTRDCGRQASKIAELIADLKFQDGKHREDRAQLQTIYEHQRGECWYWQGDGQDHLESLCNTLPVVIRADQLRALVSTQPAQAADSVLEDAARWNEVLMHIGADNLLGGAQYVLRGIKVPVNVLQGSVAQHFTKSIDAARKQGANHD